MNEHPRRLTIALSILLGGTGAALGQSATESDLAGYHTVKTAITRAIAAPRAGGIAETGYLGVSLAQETDEKITVAAIQPDSPAAKAGIQAGDTITHLADELVTSTAKFRDALQSREPGAELKITLLRSGQKLEVTAKLGATSRPRTIGSRRAFLGVTLGELKDGQGIKVDRVAPGSPAEVAGIKTGDYIVKVEAEELTRASRLAELLGEKRPGDSLAVEVRRGGDDLEVHPKLDVEPAGGGGGAGFGPGGRGGGGGQGPITIELWKQSIFRVGIIGIEFPDVKHNAKITAQDWREAVLSSDSYVHKKNATGADVYGSLNDYFIEQSGGALRLDGTVFDWVEVSKKRMEYAPGSGTMNITAVLVDALEKVAARNGKDAFKNIDGFLFLYAGEPIRQNRGSVYYPHAGMIRNFQSQRWRYVLAPEGGSRQTPVSGYAKEFGQMLGLPDLAARQENIGSEGLGAWCGMSNASNNGRPRHYSAWVKEKLGWIKPTVIDPTVYQKLILAPIEDSPRECFKVLVRGDGSEYFLLENRRKRGFDKDLPAEGLLIWRVVHDRPTLEESHGVEGPAGPTSHVESVPYPSAANRAFTPETIPSSLSPLGGGMQISITNIRKLEDGRVAFVVGYEFR
jgi:M6 family metalloprotease-like protein